MEELGVNVMEQCFSKTGGNKTVDQEYETITKYLDKVKGVMDEIAVGFDNSDMAPGGSSSYKDMVNQDSQQKKDAEGIILNGKDLMAIDSNSITWIKPELQLGHLLSIFELGLKIHQNKLL